MNIQNLTRTFSLKQLSCILGLASMGAVMGLPALAQVNPVTPGPGSGTQPFSTPVAPGAGSQLQQPGVSPQVQPGTPGISPQLQQPGVSPMQPGMAPAQTSLEPFPEERPGSARIFPVACPIGADNPDTSSRLIRITDRSTTGHRPLYRDTFDAERLSQRTAQALAPQLASGQQFGMQQPGQLSQQPGMDMQQPGQLSQQPGMGMQQPGQLSQQPGQLGQQPGMDIQQQAQGDMMQPGTEMANRPLFRIGIQQPAQYGVTEMAQTLKTEPATMLPCEPRVP